MRIKTIILFLSILILASFLRLYNLSTIPPSPFLDEVSNGYNAYSLMITGNDEYGRHLPLLLQAYNDFRPSLFVYTLIPFINILGLTVFAIRFPAALLSITSTICMFFLTRELLLYAYSDKKLQIKTHTISLLSMLLYAISPWSIFSARVSVEINMSLAYFIFATTAFFYALNNRKNNKIFLITFCTSMVLYTIAFYAYHGIKLFLPFFAVSIVIIFFKDLWSRKKETLAGIVIAGILLLPLIIAFTKPGTTVRLFAVSNFSQQSSIISESATRELYDKNHSNKIGEVMDNRRALLSLEVAKDYLKNFDPEFLFLQQSGSKSYIVPDIGPFYLFELPLLLLGVYFLIINQTFSKKIKLFLLLWILTAAIPSGISTESPQLNRMNTLLPGLIIIIAFGLSILLENIKLFKNIYAKIFSYTIITAILALSFVGFLNSYFFEYPYLESESYQYGIIQAFNYAQTNENSYQDIVVSNNNEFLESYMYYLFVNKYDPKTYQKLGGTKSAFFTDTHVIGKYDFRNPNLFSPQEMQQAHKGEQILYLVAPLELSSALIKAEHLKIIQKYQYLDGTDAIVIYSGRV